MIISIVSNQYKASAALTHTFLDSQCSCCTQGGDSKQDPRNWENGQDVLSPQVITAYSFVLYLYYIHHLWNVCPQRSSQSAVEVLTVLERTRYFHPFQNEFRSSDPSDLRYLQRGE